MHSLQPKPPLRDTNRIITRTVIISAAIQSARSPEYPPRGAPPPPTSSLTPPPAVSPISANIIVYPHRRLCVCPSNDIYPEHLHITSIDIYTTASLNIYALHSRSSLSTNIYTSTNAFPTLTHLSQYLRRRILQRYPANPTGSATYLCEHINSHNGDAEYRFYPTNS